MLLRGRTKSVSIHVRPSLSRVWVGGRVVCARARASHVSGIECGMDLTPFLFMNPFRRAVADSPILFLTAVSCFSPGRDSCQQDASVLATMISTNGEGVPRVPSS